MKNITSLNLSEIIPGDNDRTVFDKNDLDELAASIKEHGLIQPITVRILDSETTDPIYQIVAGERRFRACRLLGWDEIPAIIQDLTDEEASAIMLSENISRADLDPIDEALAYQKRIEVFGWSVQDCADKAGVTPVRIQFRIKLLKLRQDLRSLIRTGNLELGYAQIIAGADLDPNFQTLALAALRDNPHPTPPWFRRICGELANKQAQGRMFDDPLFSGTPALAFEPKPIVEPPHPATTKPPAIGSTPKEIIASQINFWNDAAQEWDEIGKPFKRQECQAASQALQSLLAFT